MFWHLPRGCKHQTIQFVLLWCDEVTVVGLGNISHQDCGLTLHCVVQWPAWWLESVTTIRGFFSGYSRPRWQWEHLWHFTPPTVNFWQRSSLEQCEKWAILIGWQWHYWVIFQDGTKAVVNKTDGEGRGEALNISCRMLSLALCLNQLWMRGSQGEGGDCETVRPPRPRCHLPAFWINTGNFLKSDL